MPLLHYLDRLRACLQKQIPSRPAQSHLSRPGASQRRYNDHPVARAPDPSILQLLVEVLKKASPMSFNSPSETEMVDEGLLAAMRKWQEMHGIPRRLGNLAFSPTLFSLPVTYRQRHKWGLYTRGRLNAVQSRTTDPQAHRFVEGLTVPSEQECAKRRT